MVNQNLVKLTLFFCLFIFASSRAPPSLNEGLDLPQLNSIKEYVDFKEFVENNRDYLRRWGRELLKFKSPEFLRTEGRIDFLDCDLCLLGAKAAKTLIGLHFPLELIIQIVSLACESIDFGYPTDICPPIIAQFATPILYIIKNKPSLTADDMCGILEPATEVGDAFCGRGISYEFLNWDIKIDGNKPNITERPSLGENVIPTKILQFTDLHIDVEFEEGTEGDCRYPVCCRNETIGSGPNNETLSPSGLYGHYNCPLPPLTLDEIYYHASISHENVSFVLLTGDYVHSGLWLYSQAENGKNIKKVVDSLASHFPDIPAYPVVGNHEPDVVNCFPPPNLWHLGESFDLAWMYDLMAKPFTKYIPQDQLELFKQFGYYTIKPDPRGKLRLIILNTNLCYSNNFWLVWDPIDPLGQLQWLADTLHQAEKDQEVVYVVAHIYPGSGSCWPFWSAKYTRIINRFEEIIQAQFYGHAHKERFSLTFDYDENGVERPTSIGYLAPASVTDGSHPGYSVYEVDGGRDGATWEVMDHSTWIMDLDRSNELRDPVWREIFKKKEFFGMKDMRPISHYKLVHELIQDHTLFLKFQRMWFKSTDRRLGSNCRENDWNCKRGYLCDLVTADSSNQKPCQRISEIIDEQRSKGFKSK